MRLPLRVATRVVAATAFAVLLLAAPAGAIVDGTSDLNNELENVGVLQLRVGVNWFELCSGTLVAPDVVLTAAHCTDFLVEEGPDGFGPDDLRISFDPTPDNASTYYAVDHIVVHPSWPTAGPCFGNSKGACLSPGHEDISLIFLTSDVAGVTPAPIAGPGYLDALNLKRETFTVAGYGTDAYITGSAAAPNPIVVFDGIRSFRVISAIPGKDAFPDRFLKTTAGVCFGDSGGPLFHNGTVVAINTWTFSWRCAGPNLEYRVDSAIAQAFLDTYL
jgi:Trypsin